MGVSWYALRVKPRAEFEAMSLVCGLGFQSFSPTAHYTRRPGGRGKRIVVQTAITPGYLFAKLPHGHACRGVPFVGGPIGVDGEPAVIPQADIDYLQICSGRSDIVVRLLKKLNRNQIVRRVHAG